MKTDIVQSLVDRFLTKIAVQHPTPPYTNRPTRLLDQTPTRVLWWAKYGSKSYWLITNYAGEMVEPYSVGFPKKREAMTAWASVKGKTAGLKQSALDPDDIVKSLRTVVKYKRR